MEKCRLQLHLNPANRHNHTLPGHLASIVRNPTYGFMNTTILRTKDWWLSGDLSRIEIYKIDTSNTIPVKFKQNFANKPGYELYKFGWVDAKRLNYLTRPERKELFASFDLNKVLEEKGSMDVIESEEFECKEDSVVSFEVVCATPLCLLDLWQDKQVPVGSGALVLNDLPWDLTFAQDWFYTRGVLSDEHVYNGDMVTRLYNHTVNGRIRV